MISAAKNRFLAVSSRLADLFRRYPSDPAVHPGIGGLWQGAALKQDGPDLLAIQCVPDKFYFLLFSAIRSKLAELRPGRAELVVVRSVSGGVGIGFAAELRRLSLVTWLWSMPWVRAYGSLVSGVGYRSASWIMPLTALSDWREAGVLWRKLRQQDSKFTLAIDGIEVADLVVDSYLRFRPSPEFEVNSPFVRRLLWQAIRDVRGAHRYFRRAKPACYLTSYTTYLEHGIPSRVALKLGIPVWSFGTLFQFGKLQSLADPYHTVDFSEYRNRFESASDKHEARTLAADQLGLRLSGGIDAATAYMRKSAYSNADSKPLAGMSGAVVVFLHDFYDSPHLYPDMIFDDFWEWICFTIDELQSSGAVFYLKQHPNQIALSDRAIALLKERYPDARWLSPDVTNLQLAASDIACGVTVYGTVAHELAYLGVPTIGCARHPHVAFGFCRTAKSREQYRGLLRDFASLPLPKEELRREALAFYYAHNLYGTEDQLSLRRAYSNFWRVCNVGTPTEQEIVASFEELIALPGFGQTVEAIASTIER